MSQAFTLLTMYHSWSYKKQFVPRIISNYFIKKNLKKWSNYPNSWPCINFVYKKNDQTAPSLGNWPFSNNEQRIRTPGRWPTLTTTKEFKLWAFELSKTITKEFIFLAIHHSCPWKIRKNCSTSRPTTIIASTNQTVESLK